MRLLHNNYVFLFAVCWLLAGQVLAEKNVFDTFIRSERKGLENIYLKERDEAIKTGLAVHIVDKDGNDVQNVKVALNDRTLKFTDGKGICVFLDINKGTHNVEISTHGCEIIKDTKVGYDPVRPWKAPREYKLKALSTTMVIGVEDRGGIVVGGASVELAGRKMNTSKTGTARFDNIRLDNAVRLVVHKPGFSKSAKTVILPPRNWRTEVYQRIVLHRKKQFKLNAAFQVSDVSSMPQNNGDGKANSGELIKMPVKVENISDEITDSWTLAFRCDSPHIEFQEKPVYENTPLKPGEKRGFLVPVRIRPTVNIMEVLRIVATIIPKNDFFGSEQETFPLPVYPGDPLKFKFMIDPVVKDQTTGKLSQRNNGNNMLGPGEYGTIRLTIGNQGETVKDVQFFLETLPSDLIVSSAIKQHGRKKNGIILQANQLIDPVFTIDVPKDYDHSVIPFLAMAESHGRVWGERFTVPVEGKSDFHASIEGRGVLARGAVCSFMMKMTYSGAETFRGNLMLSSDSGRIKTTPNVFRGRTIAPNKTIELAGMMTIPADYYSDRFKMKLEVRDIGLGNAVVFRKDFLFKLAKKKAK